MRKEFEIGIQFENNTATRKRCGLHLGMMGSEIIMERNIPYAVRRFKASKDGDDII